MWSTVTNAIVLVCVFYMLIFGTLCAIGVARISRSFAKGHYLNQLWGLAQMLLGAGIFILHIDFINTLDSFWPFLLKFLVVLMLCGVAVGVIAQTTMSMRRQVQKEGQDFRD